MFRSASHSVDKEDIKLFFPGKNHDILTECIVYYRAVVECQ